MKGEYNENKNKYRENTPDPLNKTGAQVKDMRPATAIKPIRHKMEVMMKNFLNRKRVILLILS